MSSTPSTYRGSSSDASSTFTSSISTPSPAPTASTTPSTTSRTILPGPPGPYNNTTIHPPIHPLANPSFPHQTLPYTIHHILPAPSRPSDPHPVDPHLRVYLRGHSTFHPPQILIRYLLWLHLLRRPVPVPLLEGTIVFTPRFAAHILLDVYWLVPPPDRFQWDVVSVVYECVVDGFVDWSSYTNLKMALDGVGVLMGRDGRFYVVDVDEEVLGVVGAGNLPEEATELGAVERQARAGGAGGVLDEAAEGAGDRGPELEAEGGSETASESASETQSWSSNNAVRDWNPPRLKEESETAASGAVDQWIGEQLLLKRKRGVSGSGSASSADSWEEKQMVGKRRRSV